jgi:hypothetical protein
VLDAIHELAPGARVEVREVRVGDPGRRQAERIGDVEDQHQRQPLRGHAVDGEGAEDAARVRERAAAPGGEHAEQRPPDDGDEGAEEQHRQRVLDRLPELIADRLVRHERAPEIAVRELLQVDPVLLQLRLVEAELVAELGLDLLRARLAAERRRRVARRRAEDHEVQRDRDEDRQHREAEPLQDVVDGGHAAPCAPAAARPGG